MRRSAPVRRPRGRATRKTERRSDRLLSPACNAKTVRTRLKCQDARGEAQVSGVGDQLSSWFSFSRDLLRLGRRSAGVALTRPTDLRRELPSGSPSVGRQPGGSTRSQSTSASQLSVEDLRVKMGGKRRTLPWCVRAPASPTPPGAPRWTQVAPSAGGGPTGGRVIPPF